MRDIAKAVLLLVLTGLLSAFVLEFGVLLLMGPQVRFPRHVVGADFGIRINEPGARYRHRSADVDVEFRINERGLREDRDFAYEKPPGVKRVVALGDSYTVGYEVEGQQTFAEVLERELEARGHRLQVLNAGVSGYSTAEELLYLERELLRYEPDVILVSFFGNDLVDNVRTGLFGLQDGDLRQLKDRYVPAGPIADFLNRNALFTFLGERSHAFALIKERGTLLLKRRLVELNRSNFEQDDSTPADVELAERRAQQNALVVALMNRIYATARAHGAALVIQSIPSFRENPLDLVDMFPLEDFDMEREEFAFVSAREELLPFLGREQLYHRRSHWHWTPLAHRVSGMALARVIEDRGFLD